MAKKNPEANEGDVAMTCNNLGNLYSDTNRKKEAEEYYQEALEIRRRLAKENPKAYEGKVADTCYNLALLYRTNNQKKESKKYYEMALSLYEKYPSCAGKAKMVRDILSKYF